MATQLLIILHMSPDQIAHKAEFLPLDRLKDQVLQLFTNYSEEVTVVAPALEALVYLTLPQSEEAAELKDRLPIPLVASISRFENLHYSFGVLLKHVLRPLPPPHVLRLPMNKEKMESEESVNKRVAKYAAEPAIVTALINLASSPSPIARPKAAKSILYIAQHPQYRPILLKHGAAKALLHVISSIDTTHPAPANKPGNLGPKLLPAIQALSKLLISADPALVFKESALKDASRAFVLPLPASDADVPDYIPILLIQFEALMALTNIASSSIALADFVANINIPLIFTKSNFLSSTKEQPSAAILPLLQDFIMSPNVLVRRAATQLICNLVYCPVSIEFYQPVEGYSKNLNLLCILTASDDFHTQIAASGALAGLVDEENGDIVRSLRKDGKGMRLLLNLVDPQEHEDLRLRGWHILSPLVKDAAKAGDDKIVGDENEKDIHLFEALKPLAQKEVGDSKPIALEVLNHIV